MGTPIKHPVPDRVKPSFVIFDIRALWRSTLSVRVSGCQTLQIASARCCCSWFCAVVYSCSAGRIWQVGNSGRLSPVLVWNRKFIRQENINNMNISNTRTRTGYSDSATLSNWTAFKSLSAFIRYTWRKSRIEWLRSITDTPKTSNEDVKINNWNLQAWSNKNKCDK